MLVAQPPGRALPNPIMKVIRSVPSSSSLRLGAGQEGSNGKRDKGVRVRLREEDEEENGNHGDEVIAKRKRIDELSKVDDRDEIDKIIESRQEGHVNGTEYDEDQDEENFQFGIDEREDEEEMGGGNGSFSNYNDGNNNNDDEIGEENDSDEGESLDDFDSIILQR